MRTGTEAVMCVRLVVSATPASDAAESKQTDRLLQTERQQTERRITKTVRSSEADAALETLTDMKPSTVTDINTDVGLIKKSMHLTFSLNTFMCKCTSCR